MEKIKLFFESDKGKDILVVIIVILVGLASFELGRLSKKDPNRGIKIVPTQTGGYLSQNTVEMASQAANVISATNYNSNQNNKSFFASSRGKKYYSLGCSAGKTIKQENRIYFGTKEEAERAGYTLSSACN